MTLRSRDSSNSADQHGRGNEHELELLEHLNPPGSRLITTFVPRATTRELAAAWATRCRSRRRSCNSGATRSGFTASELHASEISSGGERSRRRTGADRHGCTVTRSRDRDRAHARTLPARARARRGWHGRRACRVRSGPRAPDRDQGARVTSSQGDEASKRLLREARAMARLSHANVVTVHEVGSIGGRDFIAMELVEGETLADWLRAEPRPASAIIEAYLAAGHGLAAAHAAGIVHRDIKPHNVLRGRSGRIVVTDFGLARDADPAGIADPQAVTLPPGAATGSSTSPLSGLTVSGSLLGTPAYMAPEQWNGGTVTPATDQFAYCVALWEALTGERPYRGPTLEDLRTQVAHGPAALDASKIPRRLRETLRRGLDPDPAHRWLSMNALLARIQRAERRPGLALAIGGATILAAVVTVLALRRDDVPLAIPCDSPVLARDEVARRVDELGAAAPSVAEILRGDLDSWTEARGRACRNEPRVRHVQLPCLDGVIARLDAVTRAARLPPQPATVDGIAGALVGPGLCLRDDPPLLATRFSASAVAGLALARLDPKAVYDEAADTAAMANAGADPCARFELALARGRNPKAPRARQAVDDARALADQCRDDRARAEAALLAYKYQIGPFGEAKLVEVARRAEQAVERVNQPELRARYDELSADAAAVAGSYEDALRRLDAAVAGYARLPRNQLHAATGRVDLRVLRNSAADVALARTEIAHWRPIAKALGEHTLLARLDINAATLHWFAGDIAEAHAQLLALDAADPAKPLGTTRVTGIVVDPAGKPVAGASVVGGAVVAADSVGIGLALGPARAVVRTLTDARGAFTLTGLPTAGAVAAQHVQLRSHPAMIGDRVRLVLGPVGSVRGRVVLGKLASHEVFVVAVSSVRGASPMYQHLAPVASDGTFVVDNMPRGNSRIGLVVRKIDGEAFALRDIVVGARPLEITLAPPTARAVSVLVRSASSTPLDGAIVFVLPGKVGIQSTRDLKVLFAAAQVSIVTARAIVGEPPRTVAGKYLRGDLIATFSNAPIGNGMMCALGVQGDLSDPVFSELLFKSLDKLDVRCSPLAAGAAVATLEIPPMKRLDPTP
ncbi:MAG: protein kinase [Kofleriaceae bacterium]